MKDTLAKIEAHLVSNLRPSFLSITEENNDNIPFVHVIISCSQFDGMTMKGRVYTVFDLLKSMDSGILIGTSVIVEAFTAEEMEQLFEFLI